jgi:hypothetical protein
MLRRSLIAAWIALVWERSAPVLWPVLAWAAAFAILSLLGLWDWVGDPWRALYALGTLAAAGWLTWRGARGFAWPDEDDLYSRVEEDSGIAARPHEALADRPSDRDPVSQRVWQEHQARMARRLEHARARRPHAAWARLDRWALRGGLAVMLVTAWLIAGPAARDRLNEAFGLDPILAGGATLNIDAWIDPPAYTRRAPVFLTSDVRSAEVPEGSTFVARIAGSRREPRLTLRGGEGTQRAAAERIGDGVWEIRATVEGDATARLAAPGTRETWSLTAIPDEAPRVRLTSVPEATSAGELDLRFAVTDDYGATGYALEVRPETGRDADWQRLDIDSTMVMPVREGEGSSTLLETARHPLAGSRVTIRMLATDAAGNTGRSPELGITLPERVFLDALARAVAEQRRTVMAADQAYAPLPERPVLYAEDIPPGPAFLAAEPERRIGRAPDGLQYATRALDAISDAPEYFFDDTVVYLGIRETVHRLRRARDQADLEGLETDLWNIALRAELGSLADAEAALRAAERALMEALARGADETELAALFEAYEQAMENYMAALAREAAEEGRFAEGGGNGPQIDTQALQEMLDALRDAAELGDTADARQALAALGELLRNMQMQLGQGGGDGQQDDPVSQAMREALEELGEIIGEQRDLQDRTFGLNQEQQQGGSGSPQGGQPQRGQPQSGQGAQAPAENQSGGASGAQGLADEQGQLAGRFGDTARAMPGEGGAERFGGAAEAMRQAEEALRQGDTQGALGAQEDALADLRAGAEELARELLERMEQGQGRMAGEEGERDPLGRPAEGAFADGSGVDVPEEMSRARARDILEELRRRAAEAGLSQEELDYIERLLDRF